MIAGVTRGVLQGLSDFASHCDQVAASKYASEPAWLEATWLWTKRLVHLQATSPWNRVAAESFLDAATAVGFVLERDGRVDTFEQDITLEPGEIAFGLLLNHPTCDDGFGVPFIVLQAPLAIDPWPSWHDLSNLLGVHVLARMDELITELADASGWGVDDCYYEGIFPSRATDQRIAG